MGAGKIPFRTNLDQKIGPFMKRKANSKTRRSGPLKAHKVDSVKEKSDRIRWVVKWVLLLPLSVYVLGWLALILFDFFSF